MESVYLGDRMMYEAELKEYEMLRQEIQFNLRGMQLLFYLALAAVGGIFSYGIVSQNGYVFLIGPVIVIACIEYTWMLLSVVVRISTYIRVVFENIPGLKWEELMFWVRKNDPDWESHRKKHYGALLAVYDTLAIGCMIASVVFTNSRLVILIVFGLLIPLGLVNLALFNSTKACRFKDEEIKIRAWAENNGLGRK